MHTAYCRILRVSCWWGCSTLMLMCNVYVNKATQIDIVIYYVCSLFIFLILYNLDRDLSSLVHCLNKIFVCTGHHSHSFTYHNNVIKYNSANNSTYLRIFFRFHLLFIFISLSDLFVHFDSCQYIVFICL